MQFYITIYHSNGSSSIIHSKQLNDLIHFGLLSPVPWTTVINMLPIRPLSLILCTLPCFLLPPSEPIYLQNKQPFLHLQSWLFITSFLFSDVTNCQFNFLSFQGVLYFDFLSYDLCFPASPFYGSNMSFHSLLTTWAFGSLFPKHCYLKYTNTNFSQVDDIISKLFS